MASTRKTRAERKADKAKEDAANAAKNPPATDKGDPENDQRSNDEPEKAPDAPKAPAKGKLAKEKGEVYTYVGAGESSPAVINFMGRQRFVRGKPTIVTDVEVLAKIDGNPSFVAGEADQETLHQIDEEATKAAEEQRARDKITEAEFKKRNK